jgi:hypothetical protein
MEKEITEGNMICTNLVQKLKRDALEITLQEGRWKSLVPYIRETESTSLIKIIIHVINLEVTYQYNLLVRTHLYHVLKQVVERGNKSDMPLQEEDRRVSEKGQSKEEET